jgi:hypothetical protein
MELTAHGTIQWFALLATLGLLFYVLNRLQVDAKPGEPVVGAERTHPISRFAPVLAGLSMLLIGGTAAALPAGELLPTRSAHAGLFPQNLVGWELAATAAAWSVDESGRSESIRLSYRRNGREIQVAIVEPLSSDAKLAEAGLAPGDSRVWRQKQVQHETACAVSGCIELSHSTWQRDKGHQLRHVYYAYTIGSFTTNSKLALRAMHGWQRLTGARDNRLLIGFISEDAASDIDELGAAFEVLQSAASESRGEVSSPRRVRQP